MGCVLDRTESVENWIKKFKGVLHDVAQSGMEGGFMESVISSFYNDDMIIFTPKGNSIVDVSLPILPSRTYSTRIEIDSVDRNGLLMDLVSIISNDLHLSIDELTTVTEDYIVTTQIKMQVPSAFELAEVLRTIEQVKGVEEVRTL